MAVSMVIASIIAFASIRLRVNQIAIGFVLDPPRPEPGPLPRQLVRGAASPGVRHLAIPGLSSIPVVGPILFDHNLAGLRELCGDRRRLPVPVPDRWGLSLSGVGERPAAAFARGSR